MKLKSSKLKYALAAGLFLSAAPAVLAAGVTAGDTVSNTFKVNYKVGGVDQPEKTSDPVEFVVDRKINMTVVGNGTAQDVAPGSDDQVLTFTVTNNSNSTMDFALTAVQQVGGAAAISGDDEFNTSGISIFVEDGTTVGYQPLEDVKLFINELAADDTQTVYIVSDVPFLRADGLTALADGDAADITLIATAHVDTVALTGVFVASPDADTISAVAAETNTGSVDDSTFIDTVFGDDVGGGDATDVAGDGIHSDDTQYVVATANLVMTKSSKVISDPVNGVSANAKAIPGAIIEYCLDIHNTGAADATALVLSDVLPVTQLEFQTNTIKVLAGGAGSVCDGTGTGDDDDAAGDAAISGDFDDTLADAVTIRSGTVAAGDHVRAVFQAKVK